MAALHSALLELTMVTIGLRDTLELIPKDDNDALFRTAAAGA